MDNLNTHLKSKKLEFKAFSDLYSMHALKIAVANLVSLEKYLFNGENFVFIFKLGLHSFKILHFF